MNNLPIEELLNNAILVMQGVTNLLNDEGVTETPSEVLALLSDVRSLVNSEGIQEIPVQVGDTMSALTDTAGQLNDVVTRLNEAGAVTALVDALNAAEIAANSVFETMEEGPETVEAINATLAETEELIATFNELPLVDLVTEVEGSVEALRTLLASDATQGLTGDVSTLLTEVEGLISDVRASGLVETAEATLVQLQATVTDIQAQAQPILSELAEAAATTNTRLPGLLDNVDLLTANLTTVTQNISEVPLDQAVNNINSLVVSLDTLVSNEELNALPADVQRTIQDLQLVFAALTEPNGVLDNANSLVTDAGAAVNDINAALTTALADIQIAARDVAEATDVAPEIADRAKRVADQIELLVNDVADLPIQEIGERTSSLLASADTLISSPDTQRVPGALSNALEEVQRLLIQVQEGGLIENANATLASVRRSADQIPTLLNSVGGLLTQTGTVIEGYDQRGALGSEVQATLRDIQSAASSIDSLARQIERNPNSLLFGR